MSSSLIIFEPYRAQFRDSGQPPDTLQVTAQSRARYDTDFADDQVWVPVAQVDDKYVDETAEIARGYLDLGEVSPRTVQRHQSHSSVNEQLHKATPDSSVPKQCIRNDTSECYSSEHCFPQQQDDILATYSPYNSQHSPTNNSSLSSSPHVSHGSHNSHASIASLDLIPAEIPQIYFDEQEACLMRYFAVQLGHWFDICDGERHFACTVPMRARTCPPLLNAICTVAARHLSRIKKYYVGNHVVYGGKSLPSLTSATAIEYHNRCISYFVSLSDHSRESQDENLLAAAVILRFYEEVDIPSMGEDTESALRGIQIFLDAQAIPAVSGTGLRHAAYWIALRQEIITCFSKQRPFRLPLGPCDPYRSFEPADDYVWADRLVIHCADVLQFCFGSEDEEPTTPNSFPHYQYPNNHTHHRHPTTEAETRLAHYDALVSFSTFWKTLGPQSFKPIYSRAADPANGQIFPELWYLNNCHVAGLQHLELARILLAVYNPRLPRLGPGQRTAMRSVDEEIRAIVLRLCGIALSNLHSPPGLVTASAAIGMCGDRFSRREEQVALLGVLVMLEDEYGYPTSSMREQLGLAWGWEGGGRGRGWRLVYEFNIRTMTMPCLEACMVGWLM
ncbi:uncharacterized protein N7511_000901 [Penicillium nucicola]|uniref:uncharacterized protein n=1 Tax=Penicillium nucicola TaxID=1850975 RepID=UPI002545B919|nr:uncharacterized protein N7511_000901 [Penicillium nucicola]KAJ5775890.1 hypothetical protein N7511_000901 [Penicillium nucicola]